MIQFRTNVENISEYQKGDLPHNARKLKAPDSVDAMMKKAMPICATLCIMLVATMFLKNFIAHEKVISPFFVVIGCGIGFVLLIVHEWLHAIVFPKEATVTIGKMKGKLVFLALASYPLSRNRFILMCLLPFVLGFVPYVWFIVSGPTNVELNGFLFGLACMGMVSPFPDVYNAFVVLRQCKKTDKVMFYEDDMYSIGNE
jgi:hypothetical protein